MEALGAEDMGEATNEHWLFLPTPRSWHQQERSSGRSQLPFSFVVFFVTSFVISLVRPTPSWDRPGRRAKGRLQRAAIARTADQKVSTPP